MKQFETRVEYIDAIAKAMGLDGIDDLAYEHHNMLQVENFARLAPILDMIELAAGQNEALPFGDEDGEALAAKIVAVNRVLLKHQDSKVKAVQALIDELNAILDGEEGSDADVPDA